jgi:hypothetical protein
VVFDAMVGGAAWESDVARYLRQRGEAAAIVDLINRSA